MKNFVFGVKGLIKDLVSDATLVHERRWAKQNPDLIKMLMWSEQNPDYLKMSMQESQA